MCDCRDKNSLEWSYDNQCAWTQYRNYTNTYRAPINIDTSKTLLDKNKLSIHYSNAQNTQSIENNKYIEYITKDQNSYVIYDGNKYILDQFHFHNSSENTKNGIYYPLECHFVNIYHNDIDNQDYILVIGLLYSIKKNIGSEITTNITENFGKDVVFNLSVYNNLIENQYYNFMGTLTVPPFTPYIIFNLFFYDEVKTIDKVNLTIREKDYFNYLKYFPNNKASIVDDSYVNRTSSPLIDNFISVKLIKN
jgi:carbonic anhydrase